MIELWFKPDLLQIAGKHKNICLNINDYLDIMAWNNLTVITDMALLKNGLYGRLLSSEIYVSKIVAEGYLRISEKDQPSTRDEKDWSPPVPIDTDTIPRLNKLLKMKAFW